MTAKERLIEIFKKIEYTPFPEMTMKSNLAVQFTEYALNSIVDDILTNGIIVPPYMVGDIVYGIEPTLTKHPISICICDMDISTGEDYDGDYVFVYRAICQNGKLKGKKFEFTNFSENVKRTKAEAYKECIEKVKERLFNYATDTQQMVFELRLDNLLNELVGACVNGKTGTCLEFKDKTRCVKVQEIDNLLYVIRTNMTSITRYVRHNKEDHPTLTAGQFLDQHLKYKELAEIAVNNILEYINGN